MHACGDTADDRTVTVHAPGAQPRELREGDTLTSADAGFVAEGLALAVADIFPADD